MVDDGAGGAEAVEGGQVVGCGCHFAGVLQMDVSQRGENGTVDVGVHVAAEDDGHAGRHLLVDEAGDEFHRLAARRIAKVVQVRVEVEEGLARTLLLQLHPCHCPFAGGIPAFGDLLGCFAQPEGAAVQQFELLFEVEDGHKLARFAAIIAANAHMFVLWEGFLYILYLMGHRLLQAESRRCLTLNHFQGSLFAIIPRVSAIEASGVVAVEADIVRNQLDGASWLLVGHGATSGAAGKQNNG